MIVVCGETVMDLLPSQRSRGSWEAVTGGGPANTAVALARLGTPVGMLGRVSSDRFGQLARRRLEDSGVDTGMLESVEQPAALAVAALAEDGSARYTFYTSGTAEFSWPVQSPPSLHPAATVLHTGSLLLALEPAAIMDLVRREAGTRVISVDPNVRPHALPAEAYLQSLEQWLPAADIVKVSDEDLAHLFPDRDPLDVVVEWVRRPDGPSLVALTLGGRGAVGVGRFGIVHARGGLVDVVDTVGAGDSFQAGLLDHLYRNGYLTPEGLGRVDASVMGEALELANRVAAITCGRKGADPPFRHDLVLVG